MTAIPSPDGDWPVKRVLSGAAMVALLLVVVVILAVTFPTVAGADHSFVVRSDSMSPAFGAGSVVFVQDVPVAEIGAGDVVTYEDEDRRVTHRVVEVVERDGEPRFRTKGDANEDPDPELVAPSAIVGRVAYSVPYVGYGIAFAGSDLGLVTLVIVPGILLAALEIRDLLAATESSEETGGSEE